MKQFLNQISPTRAVRDLVGQWRAPRPHRWRFVALALGATGLIFVVMSRQSWIGLPPPPEVMYFPQLAPNQTDAEIARQNEKITREARAEEARERADRAEVRRRYKVMGDMMGMDTEKFMAAGDAERAAEQAKLDARNAEILRKHLAR